MMIYILIKKLNKKKDILKFFEFRFVEINICNFYGIFGRIWKVFVICNK